MSAMDTDTPRPIDEFSEHNRKLVELLRGEDTKLIVDVLDEVGEVEDEVAEELFRLVRTPGHDQLRVAAAIALGPTLEACELDLDENGQIELTYGEGPLLQETYDRLVEGLHDVFHDTSNSTEVRRRVLESSIRSPKPWHVDAVREAWQSDTEEWRVTAVFAMGYLHQHDFSDEIEHAFRSESDALRQEAVLAAGMRCHEALAPEIRALASSPKTEKGLRYAAVQALGWFGAAEDVDLMLELQGSRDANLAALADEASLSITVMSEHADLGAWDEDESW
jgi:hypothetical protein